MKIKCRLFGHKKSKFTDSGYIVCERCGMHEYYDAKINKDQFDTSAPFFEQAGIFPKIADKVFGIRQYVENKIYQFRYRKFNREDDLPF